MTDSGDYPLGELKRSPDSLAAINGLLLLREGGKGMGCNEGSRKMGGGREKEGVREGMCPLMLSPGSASGYYFRKTLYMAVFFS